ncbi:hypothetical protein VTL71DRAFT_2232 [Oculimacula yallundae]|uniref:NACHT domain-containing protein n=1 Tax=Oculimacula yallundae TaxID=86028 RepID=A0ABR4C8B5_9HELO
MASSGPSHFEKILASFKKRLSSEDTENFQLTTFDDLKASIKRLQTEQAARKGLRNLNKIKTFLNGLNQYAGVLEVFVQVQPEILAFIWGPIKLCLQIASKLDGAFDALLDAYEALGHSLPILSAVDTLFHSHPHMKEVLVNVYEDILDFHKRAIGFFKHGTWKLTFKLTYHTFSDMFADILKRLERSKALVLQSASVAHFQESQDARILFTKEMEVLLEAEQDGRKIAIKDWLSSDSSSMIQHRDLREIRNMLPQTTRWIFSQPQMQSWLKPSEYTPDTFWLCGIPGAGKTVIFSSIIDEIGAILPQSQAVYFYCKNNDPLRSHFTDIIKSLISQILQLNPNCLNFVYEKMLANSDRRATDASKLLEMLEQILSNHDSLYIGIDGLDECPEIERKLLPSLFAVVSRANDAHRNVQLLVTSRQEKDLEKSLKSAAKLTLQEKNLETDIAAYISYKMSKLCQIFQLSHERVQLIEKEIYMFLLARLIMDNLLSQDNLEDLTEELKFEVLPHGIEEAYGRMLIRIGKSHSSNSNQLEKRRQRAKLVLTLITTSQRPLYEHEIQGALSINLEQKNVDFEGRHSRFPLDDLCGPIITVRHNGVVDLIHPTAKDYLWQHHSQYYIAASSAEETMATLCTSYLTFDCFLPELADDLFVDRVMSGDFAFQEYAACNWFKHLRFFFTNANVQTIVSTSLQTSFSALRERQNIQTVSKLTSGQLGKTNIDPMLREVEELYDQTITLKSDSSDSHDQMLYLLSQIYHCRSLIEHWAVEGTEQGKLDKFYGKAPFKCPVLQCSYFTTGFKTHKDRERHCSCHQRSVVCPHDTCDYSVLGFPSEQALEMHLRLCHEKSSQRKGFPQMKSRSLEQALEDAIKANDTLSIAALANELVDLFERKKGFVLQALELGHRKAALVLVDILGTPGELDHVLRVHKKKTAAILKVCETGDEELFDILVEKGANINILPDVNANALTIAVQSCQLSIVRKLLNNPTYDKKTSRATYTRNGALATASINGFEEALFLLLVGDSDYFSSKANSRSEHPKDFHRALEAAIKGRKASCAKILLGWALEKCPQLLPSTIRNFGQDEIDHMIAILTSELIGTITEDGGTEGNALQAMAYKGDCEALSRLLDLGADVDNCSGEHGTPLMAAASTGKLEVIALLLERGANVMKIDYSKYGSGGSAIDDAAANCQEAVIQALLEKGAVFTHSSRHSISRYSRRNMTSLEAVCYKDDPAALRMIRLLLDSGASANGEAGGEEEQGGRNTPLHAAAKSGSPGSVQLLLESGADVSFPNNNGCTALHVAVQSYDHSLSSIQTLLSVEEIKVNAQNLSGMTALHLAAQSMKPDIIRMLLDHEANIDIFSNKGETALVVGADSIYRYDVLERMEKYQEMMKILIERGADIEAVDEEGNTVLMVVARHRRQPLEALEYLLAKGARIHTANLKNLTALMVASSHGHDLVVRYLLRRRTRQYLDEVDEIWSCLNLATEGGFVETIRVLFEFSTENIEIHFPHLQTAILSVESAKDNPKIVTLFEEYEGSFSTPWTGFR